MSHFLGTHQNRLDAKGRVSVPAPFRAALRREGESVGIVLLPSYKHPCIDVWPLPVFNALGSNLEGLAVFSDTHDDMATSIYADAYPLEADKEGRVLLPADLVAHAGLIDSVVFMGLGKTFQIWEPAAAQRRRLEARERARIGGLTLPAGVAA
ncbi:MAG: division/cell wall cluster transcriptional repressor MraZ [Acidiphilium sp.]|nr:division/cell wall cluster transcriptional repressor MraZ [Acidiphilium sp.]MDD4934265.1 division/cell wall cluster transcriptional repressor MraZ [Acidiphilium sp.]